MKIFSLFSESKLPHCFRECRLTLAWANTAKEAWINKFLNSIVVLFFLVGIVNDEIGDDALNSHSSKWWP